MRQPVTSSGYGAQALSSEPTGAQFADPAIPAGFADYTGTATRFEDTDIYQRAVNVSDPRTAEGQFTEAPAPFQEKVVRRVEVPYTRSVKVPTRTTKLVPSTVVTQVPVRKLVQVPSFTVVEEEYTEFEEREAVREKEVWVKKIVPETYMEKVPVKKTRQVQRPTMETREVEELVSVEVPTNKAVEVEGYRVDQVEDTKLVEVEEYQTYEWNKQPTDERVLARTQELGRVPGQHIQRFPGRDVLERDHRSLNDIDVDSVPDNVRPSQQRAPSRGIPAQIANTDSYYRKHGQADGPGSMLPGDAQVAFSNDNFTDGGFIRPAGGQVVAMANTDMQGSRNIGLSVKNTHTRHTDGTGVLVTKVERGGPAARAGLQETDIITSVQNVPTSTVEQFAQILRSVDGPVALTVNRDGRRNISLTLYR